MNIKLENSSKISVLILSDRLIDNAKKLADYLASVGIEVIALATTKEQALPFINQKTDFLIIAGYLEEQQTYEVIEEYSQRNISCIPVHWAILDGLIQLYCSTYQIPLQFDRTLPRSDFVCFLEQHSSLL